MMDYHYQQTEPTFRRLFGWLRLICCLGVILFLGSGTTPISKAQGGSGGQNVGALVSKTGGKLSARLELLSQPALSGQDAERQAEALSVAVTGPGSLLRNEQGELLVYIRLAEISEANLQALTQAGATIVHVAAEYRTVTAYAGIDELTTIAAVAAVEHVREELTPLLADVVTGSTEAAPVQPARPQAQADCPGAITSEGDAQLSATLARSTFNLDGSGVTVGVLSDSFNRHGSIPATDAADDIISGDLPGPGNPCGRVNAVNVIKEATLSAGNIDEGRAMLQIVHDLAPGANLAFATAFAGLFDFAEQIRALRNVAGADIIVDDVSYFSEPFFQDGPVSVAIQDVTAAGALFFTAAGNSHVEVNQQAVGSYEVPAYRPTTCPVLTFNGTPGLPGRDCHDFNPGAGADSLSSLTLAPNGSIIIAFQWAEPWFGVQTDLDVFLADSANRALVGGVNSNPGTTGSQIPSESFSYRNNTGANQTVNLVIGRFSGAAQPRLKYIMIRATDLIATEYSAANSSDTFGPTIFGHSGEDTAISVAAVPPTDANTPEEFTSRGLPVYYFGPTRNVPVPGIPGQPAGLLSPPQVRQKPDLAATNGGCNTFFGEFSAGCFRFFGTSAAAPHAAAVAALLKQQANRLTVLLNQPAIELRLEQNAAAIANGTTQATGVGLIDAVTTVTNMGFVVNAFPNPLPVQPSTKVITYTISLKNEGNAPATGVILTNTIPSKTVYVPNSASNGGTETSAGSKILHWPAFTVPAAGLVTRSFRVTVTGSITNGEQLINRVSVTSAEGVKLQNLTIATTVGARFIYLPAALK